jgi:hypothetical protein
LRADPQHRIRVKFPGSWVISPGRRATVWPTTREGNEAVIEAAVRAGCEPSPVACHLTIEIAASKYVYGAAAAGVRNERAGQMMKTAESG